MDNITALLKRFQNISSYDKKIEFLESGTLGAKSKMPVKEYIDMVPGSKEIINQHLLETVAIEYGNPESKAFSVSTKHTDAKLLETLRQFSENEKALSRFNDETLALNMDEYQQQKSLDSLKIANLTDAITQQRKEFDERSKYSLFNIIPGAPAQAILGLTDIFALKGLENIENRDWYWDPENQEFGFANEGIKETKELLRKAYDSRDSTSYEYAPEIEAKEEYNALINKQAELGTILHKESGVGKVLKNNLLTHEQLVKYLEEGAK